MDSKSKKLVIVLSVIAVALLLLDLLIVTNQFQKPTCIRDVCFYGVNSSNPYGYMKGLEAKNGFVLKNEAPEDESQTGSYITKAMVELTSAFPDKKAVFVSIAVDENKNPVKCYCEESVNSTSFVKCNYSVQQCIDLQPSEDEFMISLKYPDYVKNKVFFKAGNLVEIQAKTGVDLYAISVLLKAMAQ